ncbi:MAG TPA: hypothetical protein VFH73_09205 [Polyangia bacterium]|nr:hypothetical protein [Polyangia bacterium]
MPEAETVAAAIALPKSYPRKIFVHMMPWFQVGGQHWSMNSRNSATGIASWYAPMIGEYSSDDANVIEYQLLTMKYAGIDGILVDWPGLSGAFDLPRNKAASDAIINRTAAFGLEFGIVYEDQNAASVDAARTDMSYVRDNFFSKPNHMKVNGAPALMVFGPQKFRSAAEWTTILSVFPVNPTFYALWYNDLAGSNADGKFAWIAQNGLKGVRDFNDGLDGVNHGLTVPILYPGFNPYYANGGWPGPTWKISYTLKQDNTEGGDTFQSTFELGKYAGDPLQIATWNDYGEGTMIEPTNQFQYRFLTTLQTSVGASTTDAELKIVKMLYDQRKQSNGSRQAQLDQASAALANLDLATACGILGCTVPVHQGTGGAGGAGGSGGSRDAGSTGAGGANGSGGSTAGTGGRGGNSGNGGNPGGTGGANATGGKADGGNAGTPGAGANGSGGCSVTGVDPERSAVLLITAAALALAATMRRRRGCRRDRIA